MDMRGDWTSFNLTTNSLPVVIIENQSAKPNELKNISVSVKITDVDNDKISKYRVKDTTGVNSFYVSGSAVNASGSNGYEFNASALSTLSIKGDSALEQTLQVAAYDGVAWSSWMEFKFYTNNPPIFSIKITLNETNIEISL